MAKKDSKEAAVNMFKGNIDMLMTIEKILIHFEPLAILIWIVSVLSKNANWYDTNKNISILDNTTNSNTWDDLIKYSATIGGVIYALSLFFRLFPYTVHASGYLKLSGMIIIIASLIIIVTHKETTNGTYNANLATASYLLLCSVFMLRYY